MINPKSLENLKLPKTKKHGYGYRYVIPQEKIDELFSYLATGLPLKKAAKQAQVCYMTAKKYFEKGDIKRGIKPLHHRLTIFQERRTEKLNALLEETLIERLTTIRNAIKLFSERITSGDLLNKPNLNQLDKLMRLEVFLLGGLTRKEEERKMLTAEELSGGDLTKTG